MFKHGDPLLNQLRRHFAPTRLSELAICERQFPLRAKADVHSPMDRVLSDGVRISHFSGGSLNRVLLGGQAAESDLSSTRPPPET